MKDLIGPTTSQKQSIDTDDSCSRLNPLHDDDLSELTKKEILFWSRKLELTPSELFTLSESDLEKHLNAAYTDDYHYEERQERYNRWKKLSEMKRHLLEKQQCHNTDKDTSVTSPRSVWEIMAQAALAIEELYGPMPHAARATPVAAAAASTAAPTAAAGAQAASSHLSRVSSSTRLAFSNLSRYSK